VTPRTQCLICRGARLMARILYGTPPGGPLVVIERPHQVDTMPFLLIILSPASAGLFFCRAVRHATERPAIAIQDLERWQAVVRNGPVSTFATAWLTGDRLRRWRNFSLGVVVHCPTATRLTAAPSGSSTLPPRCFGSPLCIGLLQIDSQSALHIGVSVGVGAVAPALGIVGPELRLGRGFGAGAPGQRGSGRRQEQHSEHTDTPRPTCAGGCHGCTAEVGRRPRQGGPPTQVPFKLPLPLPFSRARGRRGGLGLGGWGPTRQYG
jgi:hypothetical protein